ncbi:MAG: tetratricopeptide repeat protein [Actinomycetota bacterium]|nr:tetratricopeptide repeat protein [Actinomycetota bacterium]
MTDVTDATFETAVLDRSTQVPVVVDLWAEWCGPCKTLGPILERVIAATHGAVDLAKVDVDANPRVSAGFGVQSIPAVFALRDRQVVDSFVGAVPEAKVSEFVNRLVPAPSEVSALVAAGDETSLTRALELEPDHPGAVVAMADLLVERGDTEAALELLTRVPETGEARRVAARARLGPADADADIDTRLTALLERVKDDETARREYIDLLEILGPDDPRTPQYRRALTSRLF